MKIKKVKLTNVKCYSNAEFDFENGINFISGVNGAGKTTIIESIGFALFDYKIGKFNTYFIKRGEKKAVVRITFEDKKKDTYIVERKISTSSNNSWIIKSISTEEEIVSGEVDVINWLKDHLGFYREDNISQIYENIISVPQGMFTSAFLDTLQNRKNKFDPIFNLEIYRNVYKNIIGLENGLKTKKLNYENEVNQKNTIIEILKKDKTEYLTLKREVSIKKQYRKDIKNQYHEINKVYKEKGNIKNAIITIESNMKIDMVKIENINNNIQNVKQELEIANCAKSILEDNKSGYESYIQEEKEQKKLKIRKREFDTLNENKKNFNINIQGCNKTINLKNETKEELKQCINLIKADLKQINSKIQNEEEKLNKELLNIEQERRNIDELQQKESRLEIQKQIIDKNILLIQGNLSQIKRLEKTVAKEKEILEKEKELENRIKEKENITVQKKEQEEKLNKLSAYVQYIKESKKIAKDGICPYLKSECINVKGKTQQEYDVELERVKEEIEIVKQDKLQLDEQEKEIIKAETELQNIISKIEEIKEIKNEIKELNKQVNEKEEANKIVLKQIQKMLQENGLEKIEDFRVFKQNKQNAFNEQDTNYNVYKTKLENIKKEQKNKNNELVKNNNLVMKIEKDINDEEKNIQNYLEGLKTIEQQLMKYDTIDKDIEQNERILIQTRGAYDTYMQNKKMASSLEKLENMLEEYGKEYHVISENLESNKTELEKLSKDYNEKEFSEMEKNISILKDSLTKVNTEIEKHDERLRVLKQHVEELKQLQLQVKEEKVKILKYEKVIVYFNKIRLIIKQAPEDISEILIKKVSRKATEIYSKIANDNTRLEWREGYEVILVDNIDGQVVQKEFRQLSGGEQMSAALAIRISMLEILTNLQIGILDEPTVNMDSGRRKRLSEIIESIGGFFIQLFVVSHDDTFHAITENTILL